MNLQKDIVLQPYGKDDITVNLIVSHIGSWTFGLSDIDKIPTYKENALVHSFIHVKCKKPKYYHAPLPRNFRLSKQKPNDRETLNHNLAEAEAVFFFLYYDEDADVIAINYTCDEGEYDALEKEINILSTYVVFGENFEMKDQDYSQAIEITKGEVETAIESLKDEVDG